MDELYQQPARVNFDYQASSDSIVIGTTKVYCQQSNQSMIAIDQHQNDSSNLWSPYADMRQKQADLQIHAPVHHLRSYQSTLEAQPNDFTDKEAVLPHSSNQNLRSATTGWNANTAHFDLDHECNHRQAYSCEQLHYHMPVADVNILPMYCSNGSEGKAYGTTATQTISYHNQNYAQSYTQSSYSTNNQSFEQYGSIQAPIMFHYSDTSDYSAYHDNYNQHYNHHINQHQQEHQQSNRTEDNNFGSDHTAGSMWVGCAYSGNENSAERQALPQSGEDTCKVNRSGLSKPLPLWSEPNIQWGPKVVEVGRKSYEQAVPSSINDKDVAVNKITAKKSKTVLKKVSSSSETSKSNVCNVCDRNYARPSTLKTHLRTHTNERPYSCSICSKTFSQAANLTAHQRVHTGERPFSCPICCRKFSQSSSVITHLRTHSGERPYRCNMCSRTFSDSSTLTKHCRIHSGEKPYQCGHCSLNFSQSGNLSRHLKLHRPISANPTMASSSGAPPSNFSGTTGHSSTSSSLSSVCSSSLTPAASLSSRWFSQTRTEKLGLKSEAGVA